jgi:hypothetical protein
MIPFWGWIADAVLALLLISTLIMAVKLDRALRVVRRDRAVFEALITNLSSATNSVKLGIQALRNEADRAAEQIERRSEDADKLATDLSFLIEAADRAGARLDEARQACPAPSRAREAVAPDSPAIGSAAVGDPSAAALPDGQGDSSAGGVRQFASIARRRRISGAAAGWPSPQAASGSPNPDQAIPSREQV